MLIDPIYDPIPPLENNKILTNDGRLLKWTDTPTLADLILTDWQYGSPTYESLHDWMSIAQSSGLISGGVISDATGGNINVAAGCGIAKTADTEISPNVFVDFAARSGIAIASGSRHTVYVDYDASPQVLVTTTPGSTIDHTTKFAIGSVFYDGAHMHILNEAGTRTYNLARRAHHRARQLRGFERASGLVITDEATLHFSISSGVIYAGLNQIDITGIDTSDTDTFAAWYYDGDLGGGADWVETTGNTQLDAVQYNAVATGLANLTSKRYGVHWIFMDVDSHCNVLYGQGNYTLTQAQNATLPASLPPLLSQFAILVARVIVQEGETEIIELATAFETVFALTSPTDHGELTGLTGQGVGGGADDHGLGSNDSPIFDSLALGGDPSIISSANEIIIAPSGDEDDYLEFSTTDNIPIIKRIGGRVLFLESDDPDFIDLVLYKDGSNLLNLTWSAAESIIGSTAPISLQSSNNQIDYIQLTTVDNVPIIGTVGDCDLKITSSSGEIDFDDENLTTTSTITAEQLTSTDDITMQGHLLTMGDAGADTDSVLSFLGLANSDSISYDPAQDRFLFGTGETEIRAGGMQIKNAGIHIPGDVFFIEWSAGSDKVLFTQVAGPVDTVSPAQGDVIDVGYDDGSTTDSFRTYYASTSFVVGNTTLSQGLLTDTSGVFQIGGTLTVGEIKTGVSGVTINSGGVDGHIYFTTTGDDGDLQYDFSKDRLIWNNKQFQILGDGTTAQFIAGNVVAFEKLDANTHFGFMPLGGLVDGFRFFEGSVEGRNRPVRLYGYPTGDALQYGQLQIVAGAGANTKFQITAQSGEIDFDNENLTSSGIMDAGSYKVGGVAGIDFNGAVTNITVVKGIVTSAS